MRLSVALRLTAVLVLVPSLGRAQSSDLVELWNRPLAPFKIVDNIYYVGTASLSAFLITTPSGHILLDAALPESSQQVAKNIEALGFRLRDVKFLITSHAHKDHAGGLAALQAKTGAKIVASKGDYEMLTTGRSSLNLDTWPFPPVAVDHVIRDRERLRLGGITLKAHLTPGHTAGCTTWTTTARAGDRHLKVTFYCSTSVAGQPLVGPRAYPNVVADYEHSFKRLSRLKTDVFLAPHDFFFGLDEKRRRQLAGDENAFIDPSEMSRFVARSRGEFELDLAKQRSERRQQPGS